MWRCNSCGTIFDEPCVYSYIEDMNGEGAYQQFFVPKCPCCDSEEIEEVYEDAEDD